MRFLVASDLHGSLESLRFLLETAHALVRNDPGGLDGMILLGDLVYHGPRNPLPQGYDTRSVLAGMPDLTTLPCPVTAVRGNCDAEVDVNLLPFAVAENAWLVADGLHIFVSHGHRLPERPPCPGLPAGTVVLRGHTHVPRGETLGDLHFWNPGSLSLPKGGSVRSYGIIENGVFRVMDMQGNEVLRHTPAGQGAATSQKS